MSMDTQTLEQQKERIAMMKKKLTVNETDENSVSITGKENKTVVNEQEKKKTKLSELNLLTPDEAAQLKKQRGDDDEEEKTGKATRNNANRARPNMDEDKIVKYSDIIDFLFDEIIVAGLNKGLNVAINYSSFAAAWLVDGAIKTGERGSKIIYDKIKNKIDTLAEQGQKSAEAAQNKHEEQKNSTTQTFKELSQIRNQNIANSPILNNPNNRKVIEGLAGFVRRGEYHQLKCFSPQTQEHLKSSDPELLKKVFSVENSSVVATEILTAATQASIFSTNVAYARMLTEKAKNPQAYAGENEEEVFGKMRNEAQSQFKNILKDASQKGQNVAEVAALYTNLSQEACQHISNEIINGNYKENKGKEPQNNPHLEQIEKTCSQIKEQNYNKEFTLIDFADEMVSNQDKLALVQEELAHRESLCENRKNNVAERRAKLKETLSKINNPSLAKQYQNPSNLNVQQLKMSQLQGR